MKDFPPSLTEVHLIATQGWPGLRHEELGGWILRFGLANTRRANSALCAGDPGMPLTQALTTVTGRYHVAGQTPYLMVPVGLDGTPHPADAVAAASGWTMDAPTWVMVKELSAHPDVETPAGATFAWSDDVPAAMAGPGSVAAQLNAASPARYLSAIVDGDVVGQARLALCDDWCGASGLVVAKPFRRRGLATAMMREMEREALQQDCLYGYLQVEFGNDRARELYRKLGWQDHSWYHYRKGPASTD